MALDPLTADGVNFSKRVKLTPEIGIGNRYSLILLSLEPVKSPPSVARHEAVQQVLAIADQEHLTGLPEGPQAFDGGSDLHPVVCRVRGPSSALHRVLAVSQDVGPASRSRIGKTGAVGDENDLFHTYSVHRGELTFKGSESEGYSSIPISAALGSTAMPVEHAEIMNTERAKESDSFQELEMLSRIIARSAFTGVSD